jgi:hypothetical protein
VGRITRQDVAGVLVSILDEGNAAAAVGKTVEVLALAGAVFYSVMMVLFSHVHGRTCCRSILTTMRHKIFSIPCKFHFPVLDHVSPPTPVPTPVPVPIGYKAARDNSQQLNRLQQDPYKVRAYSKVHVCTFMHKLRNEM